MRILPFIFLFLPLGYVLFGWAFGFVSVRRFAFLLLSWVLACQIGAIYAILTVVDKHGFPDPRGFAIALLLAVLAWFGPLVAAFASRRLRPLEHPPVAVAAEAYQNLSPEQKQRVHEAGRVAAKFAANHLGGYLRDKGYVRSGTAAQQFGRLL